MVLKEPYEGPGIEPESGACKEMPLPSVLFLQPPSYMFFANKKSRFPFFVILLDKISSL